MIRTRHLLRLCSLLLLISSAGCSVAYHDYPCGCIPYGYRTPPPLPYAAYDACPTPVALRYQAQWPAPQPTDSPPLAE